MQISQSHGWDIDCEIQAQAQAHLSLNKLKCNKIRLQFYMFAVNFLYQEIYLHKY